VIQVAPLVSTTWLCCPILSRYCEALFPNIPMAILSNFNLNSFYKMVSFLVLTNQKMARKKHYKIHILIDEMFPDYSNEEIDMVTYI
jgi:hypothetical protein